MIRAFFLFFFSKAIIEFCFRTWELAGHSGHLWVISCSEMESSHSSTLCPFSPLEPIRGRQHNRRANRWTSSDLTLPTPHTPHLSSPAHSTISLRRPAFLSSSLSEVYVNCRGLGCKRTYGRRWKRKSKMLPLSACSLSLFPSCHESINRGLFCAVFLCAQTCHTLGYRLAGIHLGQMTCLCVTLFTWRGWAALCRIPVGLKRFLVLAYSFYWYDFCSHWWIVNAGVLFAYRCRYIRVIFLFVVQFWANVADVLPSLLGTIDRDSG